MSNEYFETENFKYKIRSIVYGKMDRKTAILRTYVGKLNLIAMACTKFNDDYCFEDAELKFWLTFTFDALRSIEKDIEQYITNDVQTIAVHDPITHICMLLDGDLEYDETKRYFLARNFNRYASGFKEAFGLN